MANRQGRWRRVALLVLACALLLRVPAGWMPESHAGGVTLGWCSGTTHEVPAEARALLGHALGGKEKPAKPAVDQPCAFAAVQLIADASPVQAILPPAEAEAPTFAPFAAVPGRGLAAPPPLATGPPSLLA